MKTSLKFLRPGSPVRYNRIDGPWWRVHVGLTVRAFRHGVTTLQRHAQKSWIELMCNIYNGKNLCQDIRRMSEHITSFYSDEVFKV